MTIIKISGIRFAVAQAKRLEKPQTQEPLILETDPPLDKIPKTRLQTLIKNAYRLAATTTDKNNTTTLLAIAIAAEQELTKRYGAKTIATKINQLVENLENTGKAAKIAHEILEAYSKIPVTVRKNLDRHTLGITRLEQAIAKLANKIEDILETLDNQIEENPSQAEKLIDQALEKINHYAPQLHLIAELLSKIEHLNHPYITIRIPDQTIIQTPTTHHYREKLRKAHQAFLQTLQA